MVILLDAFMNYEKNKFLSTNLYFYSSFLIMEAERETFFRRARLQREDVRNHVRSYDINDLQRYVLDHRAEHYRNDDNRKLKYLKDFKIPEDRTVGQKTPSSSRRNFREQAEKLLVKFILSKYPPPRNTAQQQQQVCVNVCHVNSVTT